MRHTTAFAGNLRNVRGRFKFTQKEIAKRIGISRFAYQSYEEGRAHPNAITLIRIAEVLEIDNLLQFLKNPYFDWTDQDNIGKLHDNPLVVLFKLYNRATDRDKLIVDTVLKPYEQ